MSDKILNSLAEDLKTLIMKKLILPACLFAVLASAGFSETIEDVLKRTQRVRELTFPETDMSDQFESLQEKTEEGDVAAQKQLQELLHKRIRQVYAPIKRQGGLFFSCRKPEKGFDEADSNYAINLEEFFEETCDDVRVRKKNFKVKSKDGFSFSVKFLKYRTEDDAIEVTGGGESRWLPLADLTEKDRAFVRSALADEIFESSSGFEISSEDQRLGEVDSELRDKVSHINKETGEKVHGAYEKTEAEGLSRWIVLENKGLVPLKNLIVEYQSFAEQMIMKLPRDFPEDYRCVGMMEVGEIAPGEVKRIKLSLPDIITAKQQTIIQGGYEFYREIPSELNQESKGRMNGVWVKVHRLTPYGERLTREYESSGVPSADWESVAPTYAEL